MRLFKCEHEFPHHIKLLIYILNKFFTRLTDKCHQLIQNLKVNFLTCKCSCSCFFDPFDKRLSSLYTSVFQITLPCYISKHSVSDAKQDPLIATDVRVHAAGV